jgi:hypothetical protein
VGIRANTCPVMNMRRRPDLPAAHTPHLGQVPAFAGMTEFCGFGGYTGQGGR